MPGLERWQNLWTHLGVAGDATLHRELIDRYSERSRRYHTVQHLDECMARLDEAVAFAARPLEVELALWFHDAVYDVRRHDNEEQSAAWAHIVALRSGLSAEVADRLHALIMATKHDAVPTDPDAQLLVDIDLSILAAPAVRFDEYERQVREEYAWVPEFLFRRTRKSILETFRSRPHIFNTDYFRTRSEASARSNLDRSIQAL